MDQGQLRECSLMLNQLRYLLPAFLKPATATVPGLPILSPETLLAQPSRQALISQLRRMISLPPAKWTALYQTTLTRFAALVQELPASEVHHHAGRGGMLDHSLEVARNALKLRQGRVLPVGATPEQIQPMSELYSYGVFTGALLHDVGKIIADQVITVFSEGKKGTIWSAWQGPMQGRYYQFRYNPERQYRIHERLPLLVASQLIPPAGLNWLASDTQLWAAWVLALSGDLDRAGAVGEIISQADRTSVAKNLGGAKAQPVGLPPTSKPLEQRLLTTLKYMLTENKLSLNRKGAAGWLTQDALWLVSKTAMDALRAQLIVDGQSGIPSENARLFDVFQEHGILVPNGEKAIWNCLVDDGKGWQQPFTMLRFNPASLWPADRHPSRFEGTVTAEGEAVQAITSPAVTIPAPLLQPSYPQAAEVAPLAVAPPPSASIPASTADIALPDLSALCLSDKSIPGLDDLLPQLMAIENPQPAPAPAQAPTQALPTGELTLRMLGESFMKWLREGVASKQLIINDAKARIHTVAGGVCLISPGIFQQFAKQEAELCAAFIAANGSDKDPWLLTQTGFQKLNIHQKAVNNGENIQRFIVKGPRADSEVKGVFIPDARKVFETPPPDNPHIKLKM